MCLFGCLNDKLFVCLFAGYMFLCVCGWLRVAQCLSVWLYVCLFAFVCVLVALLINVGGFVIDCLCVRVSVCLCVIVRVCVFVWWVGCCLCLCLRVFVCASVYLCVLSRLVV